MADQSDKKNSPLAELFAKHMDVILRQLELLQAEADPAAAAPPALSPPAPLRTPAREAREARSSGKIAVIGMAGRFPGARNVQEFWQNLVQGVESIKTFAPEEIDPAVPRAEREHPNYGRSRGVLEDADKFDAAFFRISPREAKLIDPQQRIFLELAFQALEDAAYDPERFPAEIGVFAGVGDNFYHINNVLDKKDLIQQVGSLTATVGNMKDYVATRVSYKLNLKGPSVSLNTACSTSLVAIDQAVWSLRNGQCAMALAGASTLYIPQKAGFMHGPGLPFASDGHVRPFSADATGVLFSDGAAVVLLKRLEDAQRDGDHIYGVIIGSAINNDGSDKVSFFAPSAQGQARVISKSLADAQVSPESISFIEAHATGTLLGDPVEFEGLKAAFRPHTQKKNFCALGAFKGNIGHTDAAAGITGLIKALLAIQHRHLPASINFRAPNPAIELKDSPFYIPDRAVQLRERGSGEPLRAGISAFGFGGTNCHVIIEEAPLSVSEPSSMAQQLFLLSAETPGALARASAELQQHLAIQPQLSLADAAYSLAIGRKAHSFRSCFVAKGREELLKALSAENMPSELQLGLKTQVVFMFPGQGTQSIDMGRELYTQHPGFRAHVDHGAQLLEVELGLDIRRLIFPTGENERARAAQQLDETQYAQPAIFLISYSLARFMMDLGIEPAASIGHSLGEICCAVLSEVMSLEAALFLVTQRGRLMQGMSPGSMVSVALGEAAVAPYLGPTLGIAAVNGTQQCVLSGDKAAILRLQKLCDERGIACKELRTSHAFHSHTVDEISGAFLELMGRIALKAPKRPFVSTLTGDWIRPEEATDPRYWAQHMRRPVRFFEGIQRLWAEAPYHMIELGPRHTASVLARKAALDPLRYKATPLLGGEGDMRAFLEGMAQLWRHGVAIDWERFFAHEKRLRVPLPAYSFEKDSHWLASIPADAVALESSAERLAAPEPAPAAPPRAIAQEARPRTTEPQTLAPDLTPRLSAILSELSGIMIPAHARHASFLDLGFDSLTLTQIAARLQKEFHHPLAATQLLLDLNSLEKLNQFLKGAALEKTQEQRTVATQESYAPASFAQTRMWMHAEVKPKAWTYHIPIYFEVEGPLDTSRLRRALEAVCRRHAVLRTSYHLEGKKVFQKVEPEFRLDFTSHDLTSLSPDAAQQKLDELLVEHSRRPFQLLSGEVLRFSLYTLPRRPAIFLIQAHHIAFDLLSIRTFLKELAAQYQDPERRLPAAPQQYIDFTRWQSEAFAAGEEERQLRFWREQLGPGPLPVLRLPLISARPRLQPEVDSRIVKVLSKASVATLFERARRERATPFMLLLAAYKTHLLRLCRQDDIVVGTTIASRPYPETEEMLGFFANTLALRSRAQAGTSFPEFLRKTREAVLGALNHQDMPLDLLMRHLEVDRSPAINPVFQTFFSFEKVGEESYPMGPITLHFKGDVSRAAPATDLNLWVEEHASELRFELEYSQSLLAAEAAARVLDGYLELLGSLARDPEQTVLGGAPRAEAPVSGSRREAFLELCRDVLGLQRIDLSQNFQYHGGHSLLALRLGERLKESFGVDLSLKEVLQAKSLAALLSMIEQPTLAAQEAPQSPSTRTKRLALHTLVAKAAENAGDKIAVRYRQRSISYRDLERQSSQFASYLRSQGVSPGSIVGIAMNRSIDLIIGMLGILKAGAAYLPMDPAYPNDRLVYMAENAALQWVVTEEEYAETLAFPAGIKLIEMDSEKSRIQKCALIDPSFPLTEEHRAYIIYTSGSTGKPKGVQIPHYAVSHFIEVMREAIGFEASDVLMALTTICFDISILEIFLTLASGATLVLLDSEDALDAKKLARTIEQEGVTVFQATPTGWRVLLDGGWQGSARLKGLCGGEAFPRDLAERLLPKVKTMYNVYGPTEATVWATYQPLNSPADHKFIGRPLRGYRIYILDEQRAPVAPGVTGDLFIAGPALALGYLNRPELTAERFIADPFVPGEKMYHTGDRALFSEDGRIEFLGRSDEQVKIRGYRIELGEIEATANLFPGVQLSAALVHEFGPGDQRIVLFVAARSGQQLDFNALKAFMQKSLPAYFMPNMMQSIARIPLTNNGKIDRKQLREQLTGAPRGAQPPAAAQGTKDWLSQLWRTHLKVQDIPDSANFFELGGYSMLAILVAKEMSERSGQEISLTDLLSATFEQLVHSIEQKARA